jgi:hypothetical protein
MILYRVAADPHKEKDPSSSPSVQSRDSNLLLPPKFGAINNRDSVVSSSGSSFMSYDQDAKYNASHRDSPKA